MNDARVWAQYNAWLRRYPSRQNENEDTARPADPDQEKPETKTKRTECPVCATDFVVRFVGKHGNVMVLDTWRNFGPDSPDGYANLYWQAQLSGKRP